MKSKSLTLAHYLSATDEEVTVTYNFYGGTMRSYEDPGSADEVEILSVKNEAGVDIIDSLTKEQLDKIEEKCFDDVTDNEVLAIENYYDEMDY